MEKRECRLCGWILDIQIERGAYGKMKSAYATAFAKATARQEATA